MKRHDQLTILRNLHRARELRIFRDLVEAWFVRSERDVNDVPADWAGAQEARSRINQMLPRMIQVVSAAGLGGSAGSSPVTDPGPSVGRVELLQRIFTARAGDGLDQEILDLLDMALGIYESGRFSAMARTINPVHYIATALAYLARLPRRALGALGLTSRVRSSRLGPADIEHLETVAARLAEAEDLIDARLAAVLDRQALRHAELSRELADLAERIEFAERMLPRQEPPRRLEPPQESDIPTPV